MNEEDEKEDNSPSFTTSMIAKRKKNEGEMFEFKYDDKNGEEKKELQVFTQAIVSGSEKLLMTTIRDMSYWLELEKTKLRGKMQTLAFASAAHEFKNPLNAIVSTLELLKPLLN